MAICWRQQWLNLQVSVFGSGIRLEQTWGTLGVIHYSLQTVQLCWEPWCKAVLLLLLSLFYSSASWLQLSNGSKLEDFSVSPDSALPTGSQQ